MGATRPRPWHDPTPLVGFEPEWLGQFDTFQDWVSHASRALTGLEGNLGEEIKAICVDAKGRRCHIGGDFMRARDEGAFPIRYFVTGRVVEDTTTAEAARLRGEVEVKDRALKPFAECAEVLHGRDDVGVCFRQATSGTTYLDPLTIGDFRAARTALARAATEEGQADG